MNQTKGNNKGNGVYGWTGESDPWLKPFKCNYLFFQIYQSDKAVKAWLILSLIQKVNTRVRDISMGMCIIPISKIKAKELAIKYAAERI